MNIIYIFIPLIAFLYSSVGFGGANEVVDGDAAHRMGVKTHHAAVVKNAQLRVVVFCVADVSHKKVQAERLR